MITSTSRVTHTLSPPVTTMRGTHPPTGTVKSPAESMSSLKHSPTPPQYQTMLLPDEVIDITNSKKLLKPVSSRDVLSLTPRKRALARKSSNLNNRSVSESHLNNSQPFPSPPISSNPKESPTSDAASLKNEAEEDPDVKNLLFAYPRAEILAFEELSNNMDDNTDNSKGRLIGHGALEVYQLHSKTVNYLHCGSVVHAILPRLKILKVSQNQFILSLSNPERYWRIILDTVDNRIIKHLESAFRQICSFRDLYFPTKPPIAPVDLVFSTLPARIQLDERPLIHKLRSSASITSINTAVACFAVESDTTTYVDDVVQNVPEVLVPQPKLERSNSIASTLDMALDEFFEDDSYVNYQTAYPNILLDNDNDELDALTEPLVESSFFKNTSFEESSTPKFNRFDSAFSTLTSSKGNRYSIYEPESSWMDPTEDVSMSSTYSSSTINRYITRNLNPEIKYGKKRKEPLVDIPKKTEKSKNHRYSSYDVFNLLTNEHEVDEAENDTSNLSFTSFLKSIIS